MIAIIQNDREVPAGRCTTLIEAAGGAHRIVPAYAAPLPDPASFSGAIVLGGAMGVHEGERFPYLADVQRFMTRALHLGTPLLGICLGGQLLAHVAGGTVTPVSPYGEKGIDHVTLTDEGRADPLFAGVPAVFTTFQWHQDSFLPPPGGVLLASSAACPWQAFRCGNAYGVQFHPEVDRAIVSAWSSSSVGGAEIVAAYDAAAETFAAHNHAIIANFVAFATAPRRP